MYSNIGTKIKRLAQVIAFLGIAIFVIMGIAVMASGEDNGFLIGLLTMVVGGVLSWIGSFFTYGFGQLIENTDRMAGRPVANQQRPPQPQQNAANPQARPQPPQGMANPQVRPQPQQGMVNPQVRPQPQQGAANPQVIPQQQVATAPGNVQTPPVSPAPQAPAAPAQVAPENTEEIK